MRRIYTEYLILAHDAVQDAIESASSSAEKIEIAILAMLRSYTAKTFWFFGDREFAADLRTILISFNLSRLIEDLNNLAHSSPHIEGGDFEHLLLAIYIFLKQENQDVSKLDSIEIKVFFGRGPTNVRLCICLKHSMLHDGLEGLRPPREIYDYYKLHVAMIPDDDLNTKIRTILMAYAHGPVRTYANEVKKLCEHNAEVETLLTALAAWTKKSDFRGFTPGGDMENAIVAIYHLLPTDLKLKIKDILVSLNGPKQSLEKKFPLLKASTNNNQTNADSIALFHDPLGHFLHN